MCALLAVGIQNVNLYPIILLIIMGLQILAHMLWTIMEKKGKKRDEKLNKAKEQANSFWRPELSDQGSLNSLI